MVEMKRKIASAKTPWGQSEVNAKVKELKQQNIVEFKIKKSHSLYAKSSDLKIKNM